MMPVARARLALRLAASDMASRFGSPAISARFKPAAAERAADAFADALAAALTLAEALALAANAAATLALMVPKSAAS